MKEDLTTTNILERIRNSRSKEEFTGIFFDLARQYSPYLGLDFDRDVFPHLEDKPWWEADYGVKTVDGKEIGMSMKDALRCLVDVDRTYLLAMGIKETVNYLKANNSYSPTGIDAGTGTGILAILMTAYGVSEVHGIEFNDQTFEATCDFLKRLGLENKIIMHKGDATGIGLQDFKDRKADILVSENLSAGLMNEPQYHIISHLSQYLSENAEVIPFRAELSVSVGWANWTGFYPMEDKEKEKREITERRLIKSERFSLPVHFAEVISQKGLSVPLILRNNVVVKTNREGAINTLFIHTRFQVNRVGQPYYIEPDTANFLGKTAAFVILDEEGIDEINAINGSVDVSLRYESGRKGNEMKVTGKDGSVTLDDPFL